MPFGNKPKAKFKKNVLEEEEEEEGRKEKVGVRIC